MISTIFLHFGATGATYLAEQHAELFSKLINASREIAGP
jgi:hypothetical protein